MEDLKTTAEISGENNSDTPSELNLTGKRILVVDDVEINREILFMQLSDTGAVYDGAKNGEEAVQMFSREKYDLVLMDLRMPVMDGFNATKNIRASAQPWAKTVPVISISADIGEDLDTKCREAGISGHLPKPVEAKDLYEMIRKFIH